DKNELSKTITVSVNGDRLNEINETFFVNLTNPSKALFARNQGIGTIRNDDPLPAISITNVSKSETNSGINHYIFNVTLSAPSGQTVMVDYTTLDGTAKVSNNDYQANAGRLTFAPLETSKTIDVAVIGDPLNEPDESFTVNLSN